MISTINRLYYGLLISLIFISSCSADISRAPTNQLIEGPFDITTEWQTITFDKPLKTIPHIQYLEIMLDRERYETTDIEEDEFHIIDFGYKKIGENQGIKLTVILIDSQGHEYRPVMGNTGVRRTELGTYGKIAYAPNSDKGKFFYPENAEFVALKIRANMAIRAEHLSWYALFYYQAPNHTWDDVHPSEIVVLE